MKPSYVTALLIGAITGLVLALSLMLFVGATGGVPSVDAIVEGSRVVPVFSPPASSLWVLVIVSSAIGGLIIATATKAYARTANPDAQTASLAIIAPLGMVVAPIVSMAIFPLGTMVLGTISEGVVTLSVVHVVLMASTAGLVAGAFVMWLSDILSRPPAASQDASIGMDMADRSA
jgi:hypothetical protein